MAISVVKSGISIGVGVVDEVLERMDEKKGKKVGTFKGLTDISRLVMAGGGYVLQAFGPAKMAAVGEALALSATPLLVKSVAKAVIKTPTAAGAYAFNPARRVAQSTPVEFEGAQNRVY